MKMKKGRNRRKAEVKEKKVQMTKEQKKNASPEIKRTTTCVGK
jgi:hypothetical protein